MDTDAGTTEEQLLARARAGDRSAFDALQLALQPQVRRFAAQLLAGGLDLVDLPGVVDEVAQDVFLALFRSLSRVTSEQHLRPFLFRVCRNLCYDRSRRARRRWDCPLDDESEELPGPAAWPRLEEIAMWTIALQDVDRALTRLGEPQRLALYLYAEEGLSYEEVARATGVDVGTVKSRISAARKRLRAHMSPGLLQALGFTKEA